MFGRRETKSPMSPGVEEVTHTCLFDWIKIRDLAET